MSSRVASPYALGVRHQEGEDFPRHTYITVGVKAHDLDALAERYTLAEVAIAWRTVAGQLGRLAVLLSPAIDTARARHRCFAPDACGISGDGLVSLDEQLENGGGPDVEFSVPTEAWREFLDRVRKAMTAIAAADQAPVTLEAELDWQPQQRLHLRSVSR